MKEKQRIDMRAIAGTEQPFSADKGRHDLAKVRALLKSSPQVVALDMAGIARADSSWPREAIGVLVREHPDHRFFLDHVRGENLRDNIDAGFFRLGICVLARGEAAKPYAVLGKAPSEEALEALSVIERQGEATVHSVRAAISGLATNACNNRLKDLWDAGLVARDEAEPEGRGRPEFIYRPLK